MHTETMTMSINIVWFAKTSVLINIADEPNFSRKAKYWDQRKLHIRSRADLHWKIDRGTFNRHQHGDSTYAHLFIIMTYKIEYLPLTIIPRPHIRVCGNEFWKKWESPQKSRTISPFSCLQQVSRWEISHNKSSLTSNSSTEHNSVQRSPASLNFILRKQAT